MKTRRVLVVGLGLIGGSLALALKQRKTCLEVLGVSRSENTVEKALAKGVVDRGSTSLATMLPVLQAGDIVVIATPTLSVKNICEYLKDAVQQGVLITDVASVKGSVIRDAEAVFGCLPENFIPAHPIAGSEKSGVEAADATLFMQHQVILTPLPNASAAAVQAVTAMWQAVGADLSLMSVEEHDSILALTSHLPHMLAYTLVDTLAQRSQQQEIFRYAAGGFRDFTRIAGSDPVMWHDIALANRDALLNGLNDFEKHLQALRQAVEQGDGKTLHDVFTRAKQARDQFGEMYAARQHKKISDGEEKL
ncbi:MAG TPA: prephenate dehydrogenase/arogenate dehydrogenase family protein [Pseudomonadales bacterium]|jgi:prephenate dehydrogenase|nr:prephenate dehydrogenase/arogenate dehydrogenase family protein [Pseudomonadales bacterium]HRG50895.1 prephenate dehydrogenase/arogenate dehydrogenase family protein [Pseudomonadales bacterium]